MTANQKRRAAAALHRTVMDLQDIAASIAEYAPHIQLGPLYQIREAIQDHEQKLKGS